MENRLHLLYLRRFSTGCRRASSSAGLTVYGLANASALGVAHVLRLLRDELQMAMAPCGCRTLEQIPPDLLWPST